MLRIQALRANRTKLAHSDVVPRNAKHLYELDWKLRYRRLLDIRRPKSPPQPRFRNVKDLCAGFGIVYLTKGMDIHLSRIHMRCFLLHLRILAAVPRASQVDYSETGVS